MNWANTVTSDEPAEQEDPHETDADISGFFPGSVVILIQERAGNLM